MKYFKLSEFDQRGLPGSGKEMSEEFLGLLDDLRDLCGFPFVITSGYRTPSYNKQIGGAPRSYHTRGRAADIRVEHGWQVYVIMKNVAKCGLHGVGICHPKPGKPGFVHVDDRPADQQTVWSY